MSDRQNNDVLRPENCVELDDRSSPRGDSRYGSNALHEEAHKALDLNGTWSVTSRPLAEQGEAGYRAVMSGKTEWLAAQVPGEIHLDLLRAGQMEDPRVSDNARARCRWPEHYSWWYRTEFVLPREFLEHWRQRLIFEGIDLDAQIFLNGRLVATSANAFAPLEVDCKGLLREGSNELVVRVTSGMELPRPPDYPPLPYGWLADLDPIYSSFRLQPNDQRRYLRKPAYIAHGWDWCDALPNIGIWRSVRLEALSQIAIHAVRLDTVLRDGQASLEGELILENLHPWSEIAATVDVSLASPQGPCAAHRLVVNAQVGRMPVRCRLLVPDAQLWWPNGMGGQPLYRLLVRVTCGGRVTDQREQIIGLRTVELDRGCLPEGSRFCLRVNGEKVYCKGGNWVPADLILARVHPEHYRKLVANAQAAHFTMLRVWGGGVYESDAFYDACDRAGILVWQDFPFSCAQYPDHDRQFLAQVRDEAAAMVQRLRHHASLALWCGNNESTWFMHRDWQCGPLDTKLRAGMRIYNEVLPDVCHTNDPARPYWPASPCGGGDDPNSELSGDTHWWGGGDMGHAEARMSQQAVDAHRGRFISEYGVIGPPAMASLHEFLRPEELSLDTTVWRVHTNMFEDGGVAAGIRHHYGDGGELSLAQFVLYGQMYQAQVQSRVFEGMRFRKNDGQDDCQGVLVWSFNDAWGETGWSIVDHYGRPKASYYAVRRSAAPVKILVRSRGGDLVVRIVNDTRCGFDAVARCGWMRFDGSAAELRAQQVSIPPNGMIEVTREPLPSAAQRQPQHWFYAATLRGAGIEDDQAIWLLAPHAHLELATPEISTIARDGMLLVSSRVYCHGVHLAHDSEEYLADNYFDLLPGIARQIPVKLQPRSACYALQAVLPIRADRAVR